MKYLNVEHIRPFLLMVMILLMVTVSAVPQTDSITIEDALQRMIKTQPLIKQAKISSEAVFQTIEKSRSAYFPRLSGHVNYSFNEPVYTIPVGTKSIPFQPPNNFNFYGELYQNVFDFGRRRTGVDLARNAYKQSETNFLKIKNDLLFQTISTFYGLLFLYKNILNTN